MDFEQQILKYLKQFHQEDLANIRTSQILEEDIRNFSILVDLTNLEKKNGNLLDLIVANSHESVKIWSSVFYKLQLQTINNQPSYRNQEATENFEHYSVRFHNYSVSHPFPEYINVSNGKFLQFKGKVLRSHAPKLIEVKRQLYCPKCRNEIPSEAQYTLSYIFEAVKSCPTAFCKGTPIQRNQDDINLENCIDYQEILVQPSAKDSGTRRLISVVVTLDNDLVDICAPGDSVIICGTAESRWVPGRNTVIFTIRAVSVIKEEVKPRLKMSIEEYSVASICEWQELLATQSELKLRDQIVMSIAPMLKGMYPLKLAIALILCSITNKQESGSDFTRLNSNLMLVGDPGLGKSQLLKAASEIAIRSVSTTGMGSTKAGLTAAAIKEDGEWQLEAGALVLADGGICCIDEFNLMRKNDKASIHEALEQQTVSVAKAGIVCKLNSRCSVIAGMNQRNLQHGSTNMDTDGLTFGEIGLTGPMLSRFDLVFVLEDQKDVEWSMEVAEHVFNESIHISETNKELWSLDRLRSHFIVSQNLDVTVNNEAHQILAAYYHGYRSSALRDPSRTSVRMLDSLLRLTKAHAKLLLRNEATILDAVMIIRLMETSFGFGKLVTPMNIIKERLPLGPTKEHILEVLENLQLHHISKKVHESAEFQPVSARSQITQIVERSQAQKSQKSVPSSSASSKFDEFFDLDDMFSDDDDEGQKKTEPPKEPLKPSAPEPAKKPKFSNLKQTVKNRICDIKIPQEALKEGYNPDAFDVDKMFEEYFGSVPETRPRKTSTNLSSATTQNKPPEFSQISSIRASPKTSTPAASAQMKPPPQFSQISSIHTSPKTSTQAAKVTKTSSKYEDFSRPTTFTGYSSLKSQFPSPPAVAPSTSKAKVAKFALSKNRIIDIPENPAANPLGENVLKNLEGLAAFFTKPTPGTSATIVGNDERNLSKVPENGGAHLGEASGTSHGNSGGSSQIVLETFERESGISGGISRGNLGEASGTSRGNSTGTSQIVLETSERESGISSGTSRGNPYDILNEKPGTSKEASTSSATENNKTPGFSSTSKPGSSKENVFKAKERLSRFQFIEKDDETSAPPPSSLLSSENIKMPSIKTRFVPKIPSQGGGPTKIQKTEKALTPLQKFVAKKNAEFNWDELNFDF